MPFKDKIGSWSRTDDHYMNQRTVAGLGPHYSENLYQLLQYRTH